MHDSIGRGDWRDMNKNDPDERAGNEAVGQRNVLQTCPPFTTNAAVQYHCGLGRLGLVLASSRTASYKSSRTIISKSIVASAQSEIPFWVARLRSRSIVGGAIRITRCSSSSAASIPVRAVTILSGVAALFSPKLDGAPCGHSVGALGQPTAATGLFFRRKLIPNWEHLTLKVPKVQPTFSAMAAALNPSLTHNSI